MITLYTIPFGWYSLRDVSPVESHQQYVAMRQTYLATLEAYIQALRLAMRDQGYALQVNTADTDHPAWVAETDEENTWFVTNWASFWDWYAEAGYFLDL